VLRQQERIALSRSTTAFPGAFGEFAENLFSVMNLTTLDLVQSDGDLVAKIVYGGHPSEFLFL